MDLYDFALQMSPEDKQAALAARLKAKTRMDDQEALVQANEQANRLAALNAITQMANNTGAASAVGAMYKADQAQYTPKQLGTTGFMLPGSGSFVESPMYTDEKQAARQSREELAREAQTTALTRTREQLAARAEQAARDREFRQQMAQDRNAILSATLSAKDAQKEDAKKERAARDQDRRIQRLTADLEKAGIPELETALSRVTSVFKQYKEGELPGYGRIEGAIPDFAASDEMQRVRTDVQEAANIILKARSGAAVTEPEQVRFLRAVASGKGFSENAMRHGWAGVMKELDRKRKNILAGVRPEDIKVYNERSGANYGTSFEDKYPQGN